MVRSVFAKLPIWHSLWLFKKLLKLEVIPVVQTQCLICARHAINISGMNQNELERAEAKRMVG